MQNHRQTVQKLRGGLAQNKNKKKQKKHTQSNNTRATAPEQSVENTTWGLSTFYCAKLSLGFDPGFDVFMQN